MPLKRKKDGYAITSKSHVRAAIEEMALCEARIAELDKIIEKKCEKETDERSSVSFDLQMIRNSVDKFVKDKGSYEDEDIKITRVQSFRRSWNSAKLEALVPRGVFKNLVKVEVIPAKVDEYVRKGKLDRKQIEAAFEETPNAAYVKWTDKKDGSESKSEAEGLAEALR